MCDHRRDIHTGFQQYAHLVPGLVHLAPIDAFDRYHVEDHSFPVDAELLAWDTEERDAAAVEHICEHVLKCRGHTRHLHPDVEALLHPQLFLDVFDRALTYINGFRHMSHLLGQLEAERIDVCDHDVACTGVL